jgi:hypothetical protein
VQSAPLGFLRRSGAVSLSDPQQEAAPALGIMRLLECETAERRCRGVKVLGSAHDCMTLNCVSARLAGVSEP